MKAVFVICENMLLTSISLPMELLRAAASMSKLGANAKKLGPTSLDIQVASVDGLPRSSHTGLTVNADCSISEIKNPDIIYLPALWRNPAPIVARNPAVAKWLKEIAKQKPIIAGVGTGCCFMAEAGLLDGKVATTHWHYFDKFEARYPKIKLQRKYFITQAENLFCTGSVNSLADLTAYFIKRSYSAAISEHVERHFFHAIRQAYDRESFNESHDHAHPDENILEIQGWLKQNLQNKISIEKIAKSIGLSRRNFDRRFKAATSYSPLAYLQKLRMQSAKDLLANSNLSIQEVMYECGYHDPSHFCELFKKHHGATPRQYRSTVRAKLFNFES